MKKYLQVIFYLFLFTSLFATQEDNEDKPSYHKGRIIADLSFGSLHSEISNRSNPNTLTALYFLYDVRPLLLSSNSESLNLGILKYSSYEKPQLQNYNSRLGFEYAVFDYLGIGASVTATRFRITKITPGDYLSNPSLYILPGGPRIGSPNVSDYFSFNQQEFKINFATVNAEASLHYPYNNIDPFIRFGYGATPGYPGVYKSSLSAGTRIFWEDSFIQLEYIQNFLHGIQIYQTDYLLEKGITFGIGYSWF